MAKMNVSVSKMQVGFGQDKKEMYVSRVNRGTIYEIEDIAHQVALESGVNEHQFKAAVGTLVDAMITFLKAGNGISLQDFATFLPEVRSVSSENPDEVGVRKVRISMRPHKKLWEAMDSINYQIDNQFSTAASGDNNENGDSEEGDGSGSTFD